MPKILNDERDPMKRALGIKLRQMKKEDPAKLAQILSQMTDDEANEILYDQEIWLRDEQFVDLADDTFMTVYITGRGYSLTP